ncbi:Transcription elongation factor GreB [Pseudomonas syringae pv. spinaceae]|uniref:Transcription elongation factor GreB n=1 Tax=Pseudomonas syringae pv. spinaceae TaxID=264459 RepID=A0A0Q0AD22_PSESX|nr:Transcription elongation factor GreB [Pseudomonas syringae pv. spinaceae]
MIGAQKGDEVTWQRPAGDLSIEVLLIEADH